MSTALAIAVIAVLALFHLTHAADPLVLRSCDLEHAADASHTDLVIITPIDLLHSQLAYSFCRTKGTTGRELQYVTGARLSINNEIVHRIALCGKGAAKAACLRELKATQCIKGEIVLPFGVHEQAEDVSNALLQLLDEHGHVIVQLCKHM